VPFDSVAWEFATDEVPAHRGPEVAVELSRKAVQVSPEDAYVWTTLGATLYRAGQWQEAIDALNKSEELGHPEPEYAWFFQAMAQWQLGHKVEARQFYEKAVKWLDEKQPIDGRLRTIRAEVADLLGIKQSQPSTDPQR
jgi:tetratricopeptide (TPR) repeat protein